MRKKVSKEIQNEMADKIYQRTAEYVDDIMDIGVEVVSKVFNITNPKALAEIKKTLKEGDLKIIDDLYTKIMGDFDKGDLEFEPKDNLLKILKKEKKISTFKA